jgi:hypothetical protein
MLYKIDCEFCWTDKKCSKNCYNISEQKDYYNYNIVVVVVVVVGGL